MNFRVKKFIFSLSTIFVTILIIKYQFITFLPFQIHTLSYIPNFLQFSLYRITEIQRKASLNVYNKLLRKKSENKSVRQKIMHYSYSLIFSLQRILKFKSKFIHCNYNKSLNLFL